HWIPRARLEQSRSAGMVDRVAVRVVRRARPEDALLLLDLLVRDARVVRDPAFRRLPQLLEDLARALEREPALPAEGPGDVLEVFQLLSRVPRRGDSLVDLDPPPLRRTDGPLVLFVLGSG